jgi:hypothetical protein
MDVIVVKVCLGDEDQQNKAWEFVQLREEHMEQSD